MSLRLVQLGLTGAAMFSAAGKVLQPSEVRHDRQARRAAGHCGFLVDRRCIVQLTEINHDYLGIHSHEVLSRISAGGSGWEALVPPNVAHAIKARKLFGYG